MYSATDKMSDLMSSEPQALSVIARFGLPLGVEDKTIQEVCDEHNVHIATFLAIVNYKADDVSTDIPQLSIETLLNYLRAAHNYFLDFALPTLRRKLIEAINTSVNASKIPLLIIKCFDEYAHEIMLHMQQENEAVFPYVESLLQGKKTEYNIELFAKQHRAVDDRNIVVKLNELKNLIIKYYPQTETNLLLISALCDLFGIETELGTHCAIEDNLLIPLVRHLEQRKNTILPTTDNEEQTEELSDREKDVLREIVRGLSNKEIADQLCISVHTVISHRKNISKKLHIHSPAGLTIYAIVNKLVDINSLN